MEAKLYVVNGSHPCAAVQKAAQLKGITLKTVELPPPAHAVLTRVLGFKQRTVPAAVIDGEKLSGSAAILRRFDSAVPEPPLFPSAPDLRGKVEAAERFDDDVLQSAVRRILWTALQRSPKSLSSFTETSKLPMPSVALTAGAPLITRIELRMNGARQQPVQRDLADLPAMLDTIDGWIAEGVLGGDQPTAADLKIGASLRLLSTVGDLAPALEGRPATALAHRLIPVWYGTVAAGALPADWLPGPYEAPQPAPAPEPEPAAKPATAAKKSSPTAKKATAAGKKTAAKKAAANKPAAAKKGAGAKKPAAAKEDDA